MLFNKDNNGVQELKTHVGFFYKSNNFNNIKTDVELAEEEVIKIIGQEVYDLVNNYYNDTDPNDSHSGSGSGTGTSTLILDELLKRVQLPVALLAIYEHSQNTDVSHEDGGRRVKISNDTEKMAWEWMLDKDSSAMLRKYYKTCDRLIQFLDKNEDSISEWKNSGARTLSRKLFINSADAFSELYPIENSRRFFLCLMPFIQEIEQREIRPILGESLFSQIKTAIIDGDTDDYTGYINYVRYALAPLTMSLAVKRLSLKVFPEGTLQTVVSDKLTSQAKVPPTVELIRLVSQSLENDGRARIADLQEYCLKQTQGDDYIQNVDDIFPTNPSTNVIFRT